MSDLLRCSVKQLELAFNCPRRWAYHYLEKQQQFDGPALRDGNAVHHDMKCLIEGTPPVHGPETYIGKMCRALLPYAENKSGKHQSEIIKHVKLPEYGLSVDLRADYLDQPVFKDWKTTGAPHAKATLPVPGGGKKFWCMQNLDNCWQARIYSHLLMSEHWRIPEVHARWCYVSKKFKPGQEPKTWVVERTFEYHENKAWFEKYVLPTADLIRQLRQAWDEKQLDNCRIVPHHPRSCEGVGTFCDVSGRCGFISSPVMSYKDLHLPIIQG